MRTASVLLLVLVGFGRAPKCWPRTEVLPSVDLGTSGFSLPHLRWPRPFVYGGLGLNGGGYAPVVGKIGSGLRIDNTHLIWAASAAYDNSHKSNDNTLNNANGHERSLGIFDLLPLHQCLVCGWRRQLEPACRPPTTPNRTSTLRLVAGRITFHKECVGKTCASDWSFRLQVDYKLKGAEHVDAKGCSVPNGQCTNELAGPMISSITLAGSITGHLFWRETVGIYSFHDTVTSTDPVLTAAQKSRRSVSFVPGIHHDVPVLAAFNELSSRAKSRDCEFLWLRF